MKKHVAFPILVWVLLSAFSLETGPGVSFSSGPGARIGDSFTVTKNSGNPVIENGSTSTDLDYDGARDTCYVKTGSTYVAVYTGFNWKYIDGSLHHFARIMAATASNPDGPYTKQGALTIPYTSDLHGDDDETVNTLGDPFALWDGSLWHLWVTAADSTLNINTTRVIAHLTNSTGSSTSFPLTGWQWEDTKAVVPLTTGWTSDGAGNAVGVCAPKVYPKDGGGWIMYLNNWGPYTASQFQVGYATNASTAPNGDFTVGSALIGASGGYQAEQPTYFKYNGTHYLLINRLGLGGRGTSGWEDLHCDLWGCSSQTGTWVLEKYDFLPRGTGWDSGTMGVISVMDYDVSYGETVYGLYDANNLTGAQLTRDIGTFSFHP